MRFPILHRLVASLVLISYANLALGVVPLLASSKPDSTKLAVAPLVRTPAHVTVNRKPVASVEPNLLPHFSSAPTAKEIFAARVLGEPFIPTMTDPPAAETRILAEAITQYVQQGACNLEVFSTFLSQFPKSPWAPSVQLNLGVAYFSTAEFTKAIAAYQSAWEQTKAAKSGNAKVIADRAVAELLRMDARLGRTDLLVPLLEETKGRVFSGNAAQLVEGARQGFALMQTQPELAYRCGPAALDRILARQENHRGDNPLLMAAKSTERGVNLTDVWALSKQVGLNLQMAHRSPGASVLSPAVVNWKLGHYAALFAEGNTYRLEDPTFGPSPLRATAQTIDVESSGYFLVPAGPLPTGWAPVSEVEGREVWGKGNTNANNLDRDTEHDKKIEPPCPRNGMAVADAHLMLVSLNLRDTPVGYTPPIGPAVFFEITYNQVDASQPSTPDYSNLGSKWVHNWLSFIDEDAIPSSGSAVLTAALRPPGGGTDRYSTASMSVSPLTYPYAFQPQADTLTKLEKTSATTFLMTKPDGSQVTYGRRTGSSGAYRYFMTQQTDASGQAITLSYDSENRLTAITDALGQVTTLDYDLSGDDLKITKVTDPFGRHADFGYDSSGRLVSSTDVISLESQFAYTGSTDFIESLTTPYGSSTFAYGTSNGGRDRWLELTDPMGDKRRVECRANWSDLPGAGPLPSGMTTTGDFTNYRNTLYWDKKAMKDSGGSVAGAHIYHWAHATINVTSGTLESEKAPLENRVFYNYANQSASYFEGSSSQPTVIGRVLDDSTSQLMQYEYNNMGRMTKYTDPLGRITTYIYDSNLIDLLEVRQKTGTSTYEVLSAATYNSQHQPLTMTDAAGQVTTLAYNSAAQISTVTNAKSEVTSYFYDPAGDPAGSRLTGGARDPAAIGYLVAIDGPLSGASDTSTIEYDGYGRPRVVTDTEGYAATTDYDAFDRPTVVTFPDSTYSQVTYDRLDAVSMRDRRGLISKLQYNAIRQLVTSADPLGRLTKYGWCKCGAMRQLIDADGNQTTWTHDVQGRLTSKIYPDKTVVKYGYENTTSRLKKVIDAKGQETNYTYFGDNQLDTVSYTNAVISTPSVSYTYETYYPRIHTMIDTIGTTTYGYNSITTTPTLGAGHLATIDGPWSNDTISYTFDELGRVATRSINGTANETDLVYDGMGRVSSVTNPLGAFAYTYVNATNRVDHVIYPNGQRTNYTYFNNAGDQRLEQIEYLNPGASNLTKFGYTYDAQGIVQTWSRQIDAATALTSSFKYDPADQLTEAVIPVSTSVDKNYVYRYDRVGNRTSEQIDTSVTAAMHNNLNQIISMSGAGPIRFQGSINETGSVTVGGAAASVGGDHSFQADLSLSPGTHTVTVAATDAASNTSTKNYSVTVGSGSSRLLTYDLNGNLINDGAGKTYDWDAADRLLKITEASGVTEFVYDGLGRRVREKLAGSEIKRWIWCDGAQPAEERDSSNVVTKRFYGGLGETIAGDPYYFTSDHLGSVKEMTDSTGAVRARYDYDSFGRATKVSGDMEADFGFTGFYVHRVSGLNLTLFRAFDSNVGRWLNRDPIDENGGINLYGYVGNNPINRIDPFGLWQITIYGGEGLGGYLTFGNNAGTGGGFKSLFNGQWNIGVRVGGGLGLSASLDTSDSGRQSSGWSGNFPTFAGGVGAGVLGASAEIGVNHGNVGCGSTNPYVSLGGRFGPFSKTWTGGIGINSPTTGFYGSFGDGFSNYGPSAFGGGGFTWTSK